MPAANNNIKTMLKPVLNQNSVFDCSLDWVAAIPCGLEGCSSLVWLDR